MASPPDVKAARACKSSTSSHAKALRRAYSDKPL
jgi:hypothetical protein